MPVGRPTVQYKGALTLAIEAALLKKGIEIPEGTKTPMIVTPAWTGPRDRG